MLTFVRQRAPRWRCAPCGAMSGRRRVASGLTPSCVRMAPSVVAQRGMSSTSMCLVPAVSHTHGAVGSVAPSESGEMPEPVWRRFQSAVADLWAVPAESPEEEKTRHQSACLQQLWRDTYHDCFLPEVHGEFSADMLSALYPFSCEDLLGLMQSLVDCARVLRLGGDDDDTEALADEVQAMVLLLVQTRLLPSLEAVRVSWRRPPPSPPPLTLTDTAVSGASSEAATTTTTATAEPRASVVSTSAATQCRKLSVYDGEMEREDDDDDDDGAPQITRRSPRTLDSSPTSISSVPLTTSTSLLVPTDRSTQDLARLGLHRTTAETVEALTARDALTPAQQLQWMVLVDTLLHVVTAPFAVPRGVQANLYIASLVAVEVAEQLPSVTVAALAECLARSAQSYTVSQQVTRARDGVSDAWLTMDPRPFLHPPSAASSARGATARAMSVVEREEAKEVEVLHGGMQTAIKPVTVVGHLDVVARVLRQRITRTMRAVDLVPLPDSTAQAQEDAMEGFLSLAQKKAKQSADKRAKERFSTAIRARSRASSQSHAEMAADELETTVITLLDVAQLSTALASLRYMEAAMWADVVDFTVWSIRLTARLSESSGSEGVEPSAEASLMREVRDVCFALDYAQQEAGYDTVMHALVEAGYLDSPIPPPSQSLRGMKATKQRNPLM